MSAHARLERLLKHGDDDIDTYMSPLRGESYPIGTWVEATATLDRKKNREQQAQIQSVATALIDDGDKVGVGQSRVAAVDGKVSKAGPADLSPSRAVVARVANNSSVTALSSSEAGDMQSSRGLQPIGAAKMDDDALVDPPILLCTESSILKSRKEADWGRPTRAGMHNLIRDYGPKSLKNAVVRELLALDAKESVQNTVSGVAHRVQLHNDIPASGNAYLASLVREVAVAEQADPSSTYHPSELSIARQQRAKRREEAEGVNSSGLLFFPSSSSPAGASPNPYADRMRAYLGESSPSAAAPHSISRSAMPERANSGRNAPDTSNESLTAPQNTVDNATQNRKRETKKAMSNVRLGMALVSLPPIPSPQSQLLPPSASTQHASSGAVSSQSLRGSAIAFRKHGARAGIVALPPEDANSATNRGQKLASSSNNRLLHNKVENSREEEEQLQAAVATINYGERYRELAVLLDQQEIRAEIYDGFRKDYDNHVTYVSSVMTAMAEGNFSTTIHDKKLLIPTHSHKVLQLMSRLRRETIPIMFVKHEADESSDDSSSESSDYDEDDHQQPHERS